MKIISPAGASLTRNPGAREVKGILTAELIFREITRRSLHWGEEAGIDSAREVAPFMLFLLR
jgi:hypothetical protein